MCELSPLLAYSAELLLYLALDRETSKNPIEGMGVSHVLTFLRGTDVFHEAIVGVARKVEVKFWPRLFTSVAEPERLMLEVLASKPQVAARYLAVVQASSGPSETIGLGEKCLATCVAQHMYELCEQVANFMQRTHEALEQEQAEALQKSW